MSESKETGGPAFPVDEVDKYGNPVANHIGMTLFDYYAGKAMTAALSGHFAHYGHDNYWSPDAFAEYAVAVATAMLKARKK